MKILVSGASFAGLATAYWMRDLGHAVTIVEVARDLRRGGTAVDIKGQTVAIAKRMGIFDAIKAKRLNLQRTEFRNADDIAEKVTLVQTPGEPRSDEEFEIERNVLLGILFDLVKAEVEMVFADRITTLAEAGDAIAVTFEHGAPRTFDLVIGCDGMRSGVRKLWFGPDSDYAHYLGLYSAVTIVDRTLIERDTLQLFNAPGKAIMLNAYRDKTDIVFAFHSAEELVYDYRNEAEQRRIITERFAGIGWRADELLREVAGATSFWFDKLSQIRMPAWSKGRVVLVGDAAYCASPAAGMGGSLALDGAAAFADALRAHPADLARACADYDAKLRPFIDEVQAGAVEFGLAMLVPLTDDAIRARYAPDVGF